MCFQFPGFEEHIIFIFEIIQAKFESEQAGVEAVAEYDSAKDTEEQEEFAPAASSSRSRNRSRAPHKGYTQKTYEKTSTIGLKMELKRREKLNDMGLARCLGKRLLRCIFYLHFVTLPGFLTECVQVQVLMWVRKRWTTWGKIVVFRLFPIP